MGMMNANIKLQNFKGGWLPTEGNPLDINPKCLQIKAITLFFPPFRVFGVKKTNISSSYRIFRNILRSCENGHSNHDCSVYATHILEGQTSKVTDLHQKPTQLGWIPRYCSMDLCAAFTPRFKAVAPG